MPALLERDFALLDALVATAAGDRGLVAEVLAQGEHGPVSGASLFQRVGALRRERAGCAGPQYWPHAQQSALRH